MIHISAKKVFEHQYIYYGRYKLFTSTRQFSLTDEITNKWKVCPCFSIWLQKSCPKLVDPLEIHNIPNISMNGQVSSNEFDISRLDNILWHFVAFNTFDISLIQQKLYKMQ